MAIMIDAKPAYHGEAKLWEQLKAFLPNSVIVYNNREINGREFDSCLFIENSGILIIEVKGWISSAIKVNGVDDIEVEGYNTPQHSPKKQARAYRFALLNKIKEKHNVSPLVFDMVCYPFISREEYFSTHLDIISEEQLTIFKEDLESSEMLTAKIQEAYNTVKMIPHADFTTSLMLKLRRDWEPASVDVTEATASFQGAYSMLSVFVAPLSNEQKAKTIDDYFQGSKQIIFVSDQTSYNQLVNEFRAAFVARNIQPEGGNLSIGNKSQLKVGAQSTRCFNLEIYFCPDIISFCDSSCFVEEGYLENGKEQLLDQLSQVTTFNKEQYLVEHASPDNNTLVEAGAGTGKTYSMVSRVAYLCNKKANPVVNIAEEIAMVTFTNEAAINMKIRLKQMFVNYYILTGDPAYLKFIEDTDRAHISTIHSFSLDLLKGESLYTGLGTNFRIAANEYLRGQIYDVLLSEFLAQMESQNENFINEIPVPIYDLKKKVVGIADKLLAKSVDLTQIKPHEMGTVVENNIPYFIQLIQEVIIPAEQQYARQIHSINNVDLKECIILLSQVLNQLKGNLSSLKTRYLFVDEFQDTDDVQITVFQMLQKAIDAECRLFIVGDLKQSIYRFRGAKLSAFLQMKQGSEYNWDTFHLTTNYRTDRRLLDEYDVIFANMGEKHYLPYTRPSDQLTSHVDTGFENSQLLTMIPCHAKDEEVFLETFTDLLSKQKHQIEEMNDQRIAAGKKPFNEKERTIAILVRSNWQVEKLVDAASKKGMTIETKTGGDLFQLPSTIDLYKLLLALSNPTNELYLVNFIESNYTALKLDYQQYHGMEKSDVLQDLTRVLDEFFTAKMGMTWHAVVTEAFSQPILYVLKHLYDQLQPWKIVSHKFSEQQHYLANYDYLIERIIKYSRVDSLTLNQILEYLRINILTGQQQLSREYSTETDGVRMICTTVHKSKGLEYGTVILPYTDEDISDIRKVKLEATYSKAKLAFMVQFENKIREYNSYYDAPTEVDEQIAEESRILYVALTRAIRNCIWINNVDRKPNVSWGTLLEG